MRRKEFDYYIYLDYSENLVGYVIIEHKSIRLLLPKIVKFRHFKEQKHKRTYLIKIKRDIKKTNLNSLLLKQKIKHIKDNLLIFLEIIEFIKNNDNCLIFLSIDNNQYRAFIKLLELVPHQDHIIVRKESELKKGSVEYKLSLIIDTMLNIKRRKMSK